MSPGDRAYADPGRARSRAAESVSATTPPLDASTRLADLTVERRNRRGVERSRPAGRRRRLVLPTCRMRRVAGR